MKKKTILNEITKFNVYKNNNSCYIDQIYFNCSNPNCNTKINELESNIYNLKRNNNQLRLLNSQFLEQIEQKNKIIKLIYTENMELNKIIENDKNKTAKNILKAIFSGNIPKTTSNNSNNKSSSLKKIFFKNESINNNVSSTRDNNKTDIRLKNNTFDNNKNIKSSTSNNNNDFINNVNTIDANNKNLIINNSIESNKSCNDNSKIINNNNNNNNNKTNNKKFSFVNYIKRLKERKLIKYNKKNLDISNLESKNKIALNSKLSRYKINNSNCNLNEGGFNSTNKNNLISNNNKINEFDLKHKNQLNFDNVINNKDSITLNFKDTYNTKSNRTIKFIKVNNIKKIKENNKINNNNNNNNNNNYTKDNFNTLKRHTLIPVSKNICKMDNNTNNYTKINSNVSYYKLDNNKNIKILNNTNKQNILNNNQIKRTNTYNTKTLNLNNNVSKIKIDSLISKKSVYSIASSPSQYKDLTKSVKRTRCLNNKTLNQSFKTKIFNLNDPNKTELQYKHYTYIENKLLAFNSRKLKYKHNRGSILYLNKEAIIKMIEASKQDNVLNIVKSEGENLGCILQEMDEYETKQFIDTIILTIENYQSCLYSVLYSKQIFKCFRFLNFNALEDNIYNAIFLLKNIFTCEKALIYLFEYQNINNKSALYCIDYGYKFENNKIINNFYKIDFEGSKLSDSIIPYSKNNETYINYNMPNIINNNKIYTKKNSVIKYLSEDRCITNSSRDIENDNCFKDKDNKTIEDKSLYSDKKECFNKHKLDSSNLKYVLISKEYNFSKEMISYIKSNNNSINITNIEDYNKLLLNNNITENNNLISTLFCPIKRYANKKSNIIGVIQLINKSNYSNKDAPSSNSNNKYCNFNSDDKSSLELFSEMFYCVVERSLKIKKYTDIISANNKVDFFVCYFLNKYLHINNYISNNANNKQLLLEYLENISKDIESFICSLFNNSKKSKIYYYIESKRSFVNYSKYQVNSYLDTNGIIGNVIANKIAEITTKFECCPYYSKEVDIETLSDNLITFPIIYNINKYNNENILDHKDNNHVNIVAVIQSEYYNYKYDVIKYDTNNFNKIILDEEIHLINKVSLALSTILSKILDFKDEAIINLIN